MIALITAAERFYRINPRAYHSYEHAKDVVRRVSDLDGVASRSLILAAWWHDAIYFPGAAEGVNEDASAAALMSTYLSMGGRAPAPSLAVAGAERIGLACLIRGTRLSVHLGPAEQHGELAVLLDADLGGMAAPYPEFLKTQENIIRENYADLVPKSYAKSAEFLKIMSTCREHLFHTAKGRQLWEEKAMANIERYCLEHA